MEEKELKNNQQNNGGTSHLSKRECGMMVAVGMQGVGKSHLNKRIICEYVKDKLQTKVRGRKVLILDTQGEYPASEFGKDGIPPLDPKRIAVKDVKAWCRSNVVEVRRIDLKSLHIEQKLEVLNYVCQHVTNCMLVMEDINKIILNMTHMADIVSSLIGLRHLGVDVIVSYQSLRAVEPRILDNSRWIRMHYISGDVLALKKLGEPEVFKIAQLIVNSRYYRVTNDFNNNAIDKATWNKRKSFCVYVHTNPYKIEGAFGKEEFIAAAKKYLAINKKRVNDEMDLAGTTKEQALANQAEQLYNEYYGNPKQQNENE